jgi:uncharacterized protein
MKPKAILIGDIETAKYHSMERFIPELKTILNDFELEATEDYNAFLFERLSDVDLCVCFIDRWTPISDDQSSGLIQFVKQGGGLLVLHNGLSLQARPELVKLMGGFFTGHPEQTILAYETVPNGHWITAEGSGFNVLEEPYQMRMENDFNGTVFFQYQWNGTSVPAGWARNDGQGKVVVLSPGHHLETFLVDEYRKLITRSAQWAIQKN